MVISLAVQGGDGGAAGESWWIALLSDSESQLVSVSDQKRRFISHWLEERIISKSSSLTKLPLGAQLAPTATIVVSLSFRHLELHTESGGFGSGGTDSGCLPCPELTAGCLRKWGPVSAPFWRPPFLVVRVDTRSLLADKPTKTNLWQKCGSFYLFFIFLFYFVFGFVLLCITSLIKCSVFNHK